VERGHVPGRKPRSTAQGGAQPVRLEAVTWPAGGWLAHRTHYRVTHEFLTVLAGRHASQVIGASPGFEAAGR
jgi:hypothetical protein